MPAPLLAAFARMLPRLSATESLERVTEGALAGGRMKPADARRVHRDLQRRASGEAPRAAKPAQLTGWLQGLGIPVEMVPAEPEQEASGG